MGVLILLPVLNERQNIEELLDRIDSALSGSSYTVCIVDDGSRDGTAEYIEARMQRPGNPIHLIKRVKKQHGSQRGGALYDALRWGLAGTTHEIFVEMDGDLSHRPEELAAGIKMIAGGGCDVAIASKYVTGSRVVNRPWARRMVSWICGLAVRAVISPRIRDYSNGYRFYSRKAAQFVASRAIRYTSPIYLTEVMALWLREGLRTGEFVTTYVGRNEGISKLRIIDLVKAAIAIFEVSVRYHFTGFAPAPAASAAVRTAVAGSAVESNRG
jgi:dolichol-phosphate mannosyltransferase